MCVCNLNLLYIMEGRRERIQMGQVTGRRRRQRVGGRDLKMLV